MSESRSDSNSNVQRCPNCGADLFEVSAEGLCAACLLKISLEETGETEVWQNPDGNFHSIEQIQAAFPQFEIIEWLGRGGMGTVYRARQTKLNRDVVLKILPKHLAEKPGFSERFEREGQLLARLNHPNIVGVYDIGVSEGLYYILMEYVEGVNLREAMRSGKFSPEQALSIVPKICEALQYAHDEGILHRDIKPENILLDVKGRIKIADFGIAKLHSHEEEFFGTLTGTGQIIGTPMYMAPEQIEQPSKVDHRADIYSLGVVFYELLTGELPLGRFAPPSEKAQVDDRVDEVVLKSLEKERARRQQSANQLKTEIEHVTTNPEIKYDNNGERKSKTNLEKDGLFAKVSFNTVSQNFEKGILNWPLYLGLILLVVSFIGGIVSSYRWIEEVKPYREHQFNYDLAKKTVEAWSEAYSVGNMLNRPERYNAFISNPKVREKLSEILQAENRLVLKEMDAAFEKQVELQISFPSNSGRLSRNYQNMMLCCFGFLLASGFSIYHLFRLKRTKIRSKVTLACSVAFFASFCSLIVPGVFVGLIASFSAYYRDIASIVFDIDYFWLFFMITGFLLFGTALYFIFTLFSENELIRTGRIAPGSVLPYRGRFALICVFSAILLIPLGYNVLENLSDIGKRGYNLYEYQNELKARYDEIHNSFRGDWEEVVKEFGPPTLPEGYLTRNSDFFNDLKLAQQRRIEIVFMHGMTETDPRDIGFALACGIFLLMLLPGWFFAVVQIYKSRKATERKGLIPSLLAVHLVPVVLTGFFIVVIVLVAHETTTLKNEPFWRHPDAVPAVVCAFLGLLFNVALIIAWKLWLKRPKLNEQ